MNDRLVSCSLSLFRNIDGDSDVKNAAVGRCVGASISPSLYASALVVEVVVLCCFGAALISVSCSQSGQVLNSPICDASACIRVPQKWQTTGTRFSCDAADAGFVAGVATPVIAAPIIVAPMREGEATS